MHVLCRPRHGFARASVALNLPRGSFPQLIYHAAEIDKNRYLLPCVVLRMLTPHTGDSLISISPSVADYFDEIRSTQNYKSEKILTVYKLENRVLLHRTCFLDFKQRFFLSLFLFVCRNSGFKNNFCCRCLNVNANRPCTAGNLRCGYHRDLWFSATSTKTPLLYIPVC